MRRGSTNHASCSVNGELAADIPNSCRADITSTSIGGGGGSICERLTYTVVSAINGIYSLAMTCSATSAAGLNPPIRVDCGNGTSFTGATGICSYTTPISPVNMTAICYVNGSTQGLPGIPYGTMSYGSCKQSIAYSACPNCGGSSLPYCGNGIVDVWTKTISSPVPISGAQSCVAVTRQETQIVGGVARLVDVFDHYNCIVKTTETCDAGSANGGPINNDFCQNCQLHTTTTTPNASPLFISYHPFDSARPSGLPVSYYQWIIGNNVPVFDTGDRFAITSPFPTILSGNSAKFENISPLISPSGTINTTF